MLACSFSFLISQKQSASTSVQNQSTALSRSSLINLLVNKTDLFASSISLIAPCILCLNSSSVSFLAPILFLSSSKDGGQINKKLPSRAYLLIFVAPSTSTSIIGIFPFFYILSSSEQGVPYKQPLTLQYSMNSFLSSFYVLKLR